jgi:hypothetical protein
MLKNETLFLIWHCKGKLIKIINTYKTINNFKNPIICSIYMFGKKKK